MTLCDLYTLFRAEPTHADCEAIIVDVPGPPPAPLRERDGPAPQLGVTYCTRIMHRVPREIAEQAARAYMAVMRERVAPAGEVDALPVVQAAHLLRLVAGGSRRDARRYARTLGCGGGSSDLDLAVGRALIAHGTALGDLFTGSAVA